MRVLVIVPASREPGLVARDHLEIIEHVPAQSIAIAGLSEGVEISEVRIEEIFNRPVVAFIARAVSGL